MGNKNYNRTDWNVYFKIDSDSPSGLLRAQDHWGYRTGAIAGSRLYNTNRQPHGWEVSLHSIPYYVHRIIWVMTYGYIEPQHVIDHLDGDPFNNSISNLALKTQQGNNQNRTKQNNNTSGFTGVSKFDNGSGNTYYRARWYDSNGNEKSKSFSIQLLGEELAKESARSYREEQIQRLINEGAGYTKRHGT